MKIAILYICTGKYKIFWKKFYQSCEKYFINGAKKDYFVFTDSFNIEYEKEKQNIKKIHQENLGWPNNTLLRYHTFLKQKNILVNYNYIYFFNANIIFENKISVEEFLPGAEQELTACTHPGFFDKPKSEYTYERNAKSTAFIEDNNSKIYVAGGINGGRGKEFIKVMEILKNNIDTDLKNNIIAIWHDESHWNKYVNENINQIKLLSPSYLYPEGWSIPFVRKILLINKNKHGGRDFMRNNKIGIKKIITATKNFASYLKNKYYDYH